MKKLLKNSVCTLLFMLAFLVFGVVSVGAAEKESINNTTVSLPSGGVSFMAMEEGYYVINDSNGSAKINLKAKSKVKGVAPSQVVYTAKVSIVTCKTLSNGVCTTWSLYEYGEKDDVTMDNLYKTMTLNLKDTKFTDRQDLTNVLGKPVGELTSVYGVDKTYFVIVQYKQANMSLSWLFNGFEYDVYAAEVYKVALGSDLVDIYMETPTSSAGRVGISYVSGTPINSVRYFKSLQQLPSTFDFDTEYSSNGGQVVLQRAKSNNIATNDGMFTFDFQISSGEGYYYIEATDLEGNTTVDLVEVNVDNSVENENIDTNTGSDTNNDDSNVNDENVGKIIFIALIVILVVSVVLIIVQKIVDNKKKIY